MNLDSQIRKLARSVYWQNLYRSSKDAYGIGLFKNTANFSSVQVNFLYWLQIYDMLYTELQKQEWGSILTERVINNDIRCDAFLYWRTKSIKKQIRNQKIEEQKQKIRSKGNHKGPITPFEVDLIR